MKNIQKQKHSQMNNSPEGVGQIRFLAFDARTSASASPPNVHAFQYINIRASQYTEHGYPVQLAAAVFFIVAFFILKFLSYTDARLFCVLDDASRGLFCILTPRTCMQIREIAFIFQPALRRNHLTYYGWNISLTTLR